MRRMQAAGIDAFGGEVRMLELAAPASPAPDEVVISVHAAGVANWDEFVRVRRLGRRPPSRRWRSASRRRVSSPRSART